MGVKTYKPITAGMRQWTSLDFSELTKKTRPEKSLTLGRTERAGRDWNGRISVRHKGGGHKRRYRNIDFKRDKIGVIGKVVTIEYDPNRSANIALIHYVDGDKRYIIAQRACGGEHDQGGAPPQGTSLPPKGLWWGTRSRRGPTPH